MDKHINTRTLVEQAEEIVAEAAAGTTRFIVQGAGAEVVIARMDVLPQPDVPEGRKAMEALWADVGAYDLPPMTMDEIDEEIAAYRREKREAAARGQ